MRRFLVLRVLVRDELLEFLPYFERDDFLELLLELLPPEDDFFDFDDEDDLFDLDDDDFFVFDFDDLDDWLVFAFDDFFA